MIRKSENIVFYRRHEDGYRGKRVVVVGVGNTACDVAVDLSSVCSQVILTMMS